MRGTGRNQTDVLRDNLCDIARDVLEDKMDWLKDEIIEDACDGIADSLLEHLGELRKGISEVDEEANECDNAECDSECDNALSEDRELLLKAIRIVVEYRKPSASYLQRQLGIGYNKSAALLEMMERYDIVSPQEGSRSRTILVDTYEEAVNRLPKQN
jgi:DNA segregation ATPase FtsK/SpoIIIE-like protein